MQHLPNFPVELDPIYFSQSVVESIDSLRVTKVCLQCIFLIVLYNCWLIWLFSAKHQAANISRIFMKRIRSIIHHKKDRKKKEKEINIETAVRWDNWENSFWLPLEKCRLSRMLQVTIFCVTEPSLSEIYRRNRLRGRSVTFSKRIAHYGPRSGFLYYNV